MTTSSAQARLLRRQQDADHDGPDWKTNPSTDSEIQAAGLLGLSWDDDDDEDEDV